SALYDPAPHLPLPSFPTRRSSDLTATGQHCPEGWTLYQLPGPQLKGVMDPGSAEASYYDWVDQFDTFGLGKNVPIATGNGNDARSEEHTSELQSLRHLVCRLLLEK